MEQLDAAAGPRRGFLKLLAGFVSAVGSALAVIPGLGFLAHPLREDTVSGGEEPIRVARLGDLEPGKPLRRDVVGQQKDAWLRLDNVKLGACWLVASTNGTVKAFSTVCPHLGCSIDWSDKKKAFDCPCHDSDFDMESGKCLKGPSLRGLDELEVITEGEEVKVKYQRFKMAIAKKEPV